MWLSSDFAAHIIKLLPWICSLRHNRYSSCLFSYIGLIGYFQILGLAELCPLILRNYHGAYAKFIYWKLVICTKTRVWYEYKFNCSTLLRVTMCGRLTRSSFYVNRYRYILTKTVVAHLMCDIGKLICHWLPTHMLYTYSTLLNISKLSIYFNVIYLKAFYVIPTSRIVYTYEGNKHKIVYNLIYVLKPKIR